MLRVDPALLAEFREVAGAAGNFSAAVDEGVRWWITREKRRRAAAKPAATRNGNAPARAKAAASKRLAGRPR
jgi:hypothetical protein